MPEFSTLDDFLEEEGLYDGAEKEALRRVKAWLEDLNARVERACFNGEFDGEIVTEYATALVMRANYGYSKIASYLIGFQNRNYNYFTSSDFQRLIAECIRLCVEQGMEEVLKEIKRVSRGQ